MLTTEALIAEKRKDEKPAWAAATSEIRLGRSWTLSRLLCALRGNSVRTELD